MDKGKKSLPIPWEGAAVVDILEAKEYLVNVGSSTPVRAGVEFERLYFKNAVSHGFVMNSGAVVDTSGFLFCEICFTFTLF